MTLDRLRPVADRAMTPFVDAAVRLGVTPNSLSVGSLVLAGGAGAAYFVAGESPAFYLAGAALVVLNGWLDLLDGALARRLGSDSRAGDLLDHVIDRYADLIILAGLAGGIDRYALGFAAVTGVLMTSYLGTQAQAVGLERAYGGLVGRADRLAIIGLVTAVATVRSQVAGFGVVTFLLVFFAIVGHFTAVQRFYFAFRRLT